MPFIIHLVLQGNHDEPLGEPGCCKLLGNLPARMNE